MVMLYAEPKEKVSPGGIIYPDYERYTIKGPEGGFRKQKPPRRHISGYAVVVEVGPTIGEDLLPGDRVVFDRFTGSDVRFERDGPLFTITHYSNVLAMVEEEG